MSRPGVVQFVRCANCKCPIPKDESGIRRGQLAECEQCREERQSSPHLLDPPRPDYGPPDRAMPGNGRTRRVAWIDILRHCATCGDGALGRHVRCPGCRAKDETTGRAVARRKP